MRGQEHDMWLLSYIFRILKEIEMVGNGSSFSQRNLIEYLAQYLKQLWVYSF